MKENAMSRLRSADPGWAIALLSLLLASVFLAAGYAGLNGWAHLVGIFGTAGGAHQAGAIVGIAGALGLLVGAVRFYAAVLLALAMAGSALSHLLVTGGDPIPAIVLLALTCMVAYATAPEPTHPNLRLGGT
jgi:uncharacterized membrane protein YphA (DoxX/SURF4 family)